MAYPSEEKYTKAVLKRWEDIPGPAPARGDAVRDQAPAWLRQRGESRPAPNGSRRSSSSPRSARSATTSARSSSCCPTRWASACWSTTSTTVASRARRRARSKARSTFRTRRRSRTAPAWPTPRRAFRASSPARCAGSTAGRSRARCSTCGRPTARASTRSSAAPPSRGCAASTSTQADGSYSIRTVAPISYTIPMDGPVGELFERTDMSHMRPAHIHFAVSAPGYH